MSDKEKKEVEQTESTHDINSNVGKFTNVATPVDESEVAEEEVNKKSVKINFKKFDSAKNYGTSSVGRFKSFLDIRLNRKKSLVYIWVMYVAVLAVALIAGICFIYFTNRNLHDATRNFNHILEVKNTGLAGMVFAYIAIFLPIIPLFILFISWLVQINGTYKSTSFHFTCVVVFIMAISFLVLATIMCSIYLGLSSVQTFA